MTQAYHAHFIPEGWQNDYAIALDPEGDTEWDVTAAVAEFPPAYMALLLPELESDAEAIDVWDLLKDHPSAPEWVRAWSGPNTLRICKSEFCAV